MSKLTKLFSLVSAVAMLLTCVQTIPVQASDLTSIHAEGVKINTADFNAVFVGDLNERIPLNTANSYSEITAEIQDMTLSVDSVAFDLQMPGVELEVEGALTGGYKQENGINSYVSMDATTDVATYEVLLLEVFLDTRADSSMLVKTGLVGPHIKLYMLQGSDVYLFEVALPETMPVPMMIAEEDIIEQDICWFKDIVEPAEIVEVETTPAILEELGISTSQTYALESVTTWTNSTTYTLTYNVGEDTFVSQSLPYVEYMHTNVYGATSDWQMNFKIAEHTKVNGTTSRAATNAIRYHNVEMSMGCGARTRFTASARTGRGIDSASLIEAGNSTVVDILSKTLSSYKTAVTLAEVIGWLNSVDRATQSITFGNAFSSVEDMYENVVGADFKNMELYECTSYNGNTNNGHYLMFQGRVARVGGVPASAVSTVGAMKIIFDVYNYHTNSTTTVAPSEFSLSYTVTTN